MHMIPKFNMKDVRRWYKSKKMKGYLNYYSKYKIRNSKTVIDFSIKSETIIKTLKFIKMLDKLWAKIFRIGMNFYISFQVKIIWINTKEIKL